MAVKYTEEQLHTIDKSILIQMLLQSQEQGMSGAVKYKPYVLLSATSMRKELTMSMCVRGNEQDKAVVEHFFDLFEKNISALTASS